MRLINVNTLELKQFFDGDRPKYCILSHRWVDGETTLQAFEVEKHGEESGSQGSDTGAAASPGTLKVKRFCRLVREQTSCEWCWVDTCCIDKSSSAELTEAINSMYRWYREADICYVYVNDIRHDDLEDEADDAAEEGAESPSGLYAVDVGDSGYYGDGGLEPHKLAMIHASLASSKWFTRGWTLQELLAPRIQVYLDCEWRPVGSRDELAPALTAITGIPSKCFGSPATVRQCCVAERMRWLSTRNTSRVEDLAYCMLGIFDVYMPLIYGEGQHAFRRLQEEIIKVSDDESIFAWVAAPDTPPSSGLLASDPRDFGRLVGHPLRLTRYMDRKPFAITNKGLEFQIFDSTAIMRFPNCEFPLDVARSSEGLGNLDEHEDELFIVSLERHGHGWRRANCHQAFWVGEMKLTRAGFTGQWSKPDRTKVKIYIEPVTGAFSRHV